MQGFSFPDFCAGLYDRGMKVQKDYKTVLNEAVAEYEEKKSRFIATVRPVSSEEEAQGFIAGLRSRYWDATHNVYAYMLGGNNRVQKFSDDGEPSGTAGLPVLEAIRKMDLQDVVVVVTRYFGGTLLGAAGLVRAYGKSASVGLREAGVLNRRLCSVVQVITEYTVFGKLQALLASQGTLIRSITYEQDVELTVCIPVDETGGFVEMITDETCGRALIQVGEAEFVSVLENGTMI